MEGAGGNMQSPHHQPIGKLGFFILVQTLELQEERSDGFLLLLFAHVCVPFDHGAKNLLRGIWRSTHRDSAMHKKEEMGKSVTRTTLEESCTEVHEGPYNSSKNKENADSSRACTMGQVYPCALNRGMDSGGASQRLWCILG